MNWGGSFNGISELLRFDKIPSTQHPFGCGYSSKAPNETSGFPCEPSGHVGGHQVGLQLLLTTAWLGQFRRAIHNHTRVGKWTKVPVQPCAAVHYRQHGLYWGLTFHIIGKRVVDRLNTTPKHSRALPAVIGGSAITFRNVADTGMYSRKQNA